MAAKSWDLWSLPPPQRILGAEETRFDLDRVAKDLTVVMSTSISNFAPSTDIPLKALESLQANVALRWCRKLLVFDAVPSPEEIHEMQRDKRSFSEVVRGKKWLDMWNAKRGDYHEYCELFRELDKRNHPALFNVQLVFLPRFGHLYGTVQTALSILKTPYVFITQHDLRISPKFVAADVQHILAALDGEVARYVLLNRDVNSSARTRGYFKLAHLDVANNFTAMAGFSDQAHFAQTNWYRREVLEAIEANERLTCMEHVLHDRWRESGEWHGTVLYGGLNEGPFVYDLVYGFQTYAEGKLMRFPPPPTRVAG